MRLLRNLCELLFLHIFSRWKYMGSGATPHGPDASGHGQPNIMSNCHTGIGANFVGPDRPRSSIEPSSLNILALGSSDHKSSIIHIFCPRMRFTVPKKPLAAGASPQTPAGSLWHPTLLTNIPTCLIVHWMLKMDEPPQYFPYFGAYGYWDHVTTRHMISVSIALTTSVARPGGGTSLVCPRAQKTLVTPLVRQSLWLRLGVNVDDQLCLRLNPNPIPNRNPSPNPNQRHYQVNNNELTNNYKPPVLVVPVHYSAPACWPMAGLQHAVLLQVCKGAQAFSA